MALDKLKEAVRKLHEQVMGRATASCPIQTERAKKFDVGPPRTSQDIVRIQAQHALWLAPFRKNVSEVHDNEGEADTAEFSFSSASTKIQLDDLVNYGRTYGVKILRIEYNGYTMRIIVGMAPGR